VGGWGVGVGGGGGGGSQRGASLGEGPEKIGAMGERGAVPSCVGGYQREGRGGEKRGATMKKD